MLEPYRFGFGINYRKQLEKVAGEEKTKEAMKQIVRADKEGGISGKLLRNKKLMKDFQGDDVRDLAVSVVENLNNAKTKEEYDRLKRNYNRILHSSRKPNYREKLLEGSPEQKKDRINNIIKADKRCLITGKLLRKKGLMKSEDLKNHATGFAHTILVNSADIKGDDKKTIARFSKTLDYIFVKNSKLLLQGPNGKKLDDNGLKERMLSFVEADKKGIITKKLISKGARKRGFLGDPNNINGDDVKNIAVKILNNRAKPNLDEETAKRLDKPLNQIIFSKEYRKRLLADNGQEVEGRLTKIIENDKTGVVTTKMLTKKSMWGENPSGEQVQGMAIRILNNLGEAREKNDKEAIKRLEAARDRLMSSKRREHGINFFKRLNSENFAAIEKDVGNKHPEEINRLRELHHKEDKKLRTRIIGKP